jgi:hypothetical protein
MYQRQPLAPPLHICPAELARWQCFSASVRAPSAPVRRVRAFT